MVLPNKLDRLSQEDRNILGEFYNGYSTRQWFHRAEIIEKHPKHMKKTLELSVNYNPVLEMKEVLSFTQRYNMAIDIIDLSNKS